MGCASSNNVQQEPPTNHVDVELAEAAAAERYHFKVGLSPLETMLPSDICFACESNQTIPIVTPADRLVRFRRDEYLSSIWQQVACAVR